MDAKVYGALFRELRIKKNITQIQLADGICSERHIKNIENGRNLPNFKLLSDLSDKLGHQIFELAFLAEVKMDSEGYDHYNILDEYYQNHEYVELRKYMALFKDQLNTYDSHHIKQKMFWYEGICLGNLDHDYDGCRKALTVAWQISYPDDSLSLDGKYLTKAELHIFNSFAANEFSIRNYYRAIELYEALYVYLTTYKIMYMPRLYPLSCYNLLKCYNNIKDYEMGIHFGKKVLTHSQKQLSMEMLAETYFELGMAYMETDEKTFGLKAFKKSMVLAQLFSNNEAVNDAMVYLSKTYGLTVDEDLMSGMYE